MPPFTVRMDTPYLNHGFAVDPFSYQFPGEYSQAEIDMLPSLLTPQVMNKARSKISQVMPKTYGDPDFDRSVIVIVDVNEPDATNVIRFVDS